MPPFRNQLYCILFLVSFLFNLHHLWHHQSYKFSIFLFQLFLLFVLISVPYFIFHILSSSQTFKHKANWRSQTTTIHSIANKTVLCSIIDHRPTFLLRAEVQPNEETLPRPAQKIISFLKLSFQMYLWPLLFLLNWLELALSGLNRSPRNCSLSLLFRTIFSPALFSTEM